MNTEAILAQALNRSFAVQEQIDTLVNSPGLFIPDLPTNKRTQIATALFSLAIEQAGSVTFLYQNKHYKAGLALARSVLEIYCRGKWIKKHAKEKTIASFSSNRFPEMSLLIEKTLSRLLDPEGSADDFFPTVYKNLSEYVHGGVRMFGMQLSETGVGFGSAYNWEELREVLMISDMMQLFSAVELLGFTRCRGDDDCQNLKKDHTQCARFQTVLGKLNNHVQRYSAEM